MARGPGRSAHLHVVFLLGNIAVGGQGLVINKDFEHAGVNGTKTKASLIAFSDIHGIFLDDEGRSLPFGSNFYDFQHSPTAKQVENSNADVVIYMGDMSTTLNMEYPKQKCTFESYVQISQFLRWFASLSSPNKIVLAGNHDDCLEQTKASWWSTGFPMALRNQMQAQDIHFLANELLTLHLHGVPFRILGSPASEGRNKPDERTGIPWWEYGAYQYYPGSESYKALVNLLQEPDNEKPDMLIMHGPPLNWGGKWLGGVEPQGELIEAIAANNPKMILVGHIHGQGQARPGEWQHVRGIPMYNVAVKYETAGKPEPNHEFRMRALELTFDPHNIGAVIPTAPTPHHRTRFSRNHA